jgi:hypothetical protein
VIERGEGERPLERWPSRYGDAALFTLLAVLVLNITPHLRGFWQDDTLHFSMVFQRSGDLPALVQPFGTPMRHLYLLPSWLALATPRPILTLHLIHAAFWLFEALLAGWMAILLLPGRAFVRFTAIALTLTATSDYLTNSLTPLGYHFAIVMVLLAVASGLRFTSRGGVLWLTIAALSLFISVWTVDVAFLVMPFVPLLFFLRGASSSNRGAEGRRALLLLGVCAVATLPAMIQEVRFLLDPRGYAASAIVRMPFRQLAARAVRLYLENFKPWRWVFSRPLFGVRPLPSIPPPLQALLAAVAASAFFLRVRSRPLDKNVSQNESRNEWKSAPPLVALFALMALVFNVLYARLTMAEFHNRTHLMSRIWVSLAIAIAAGWARDRWPHARGVIHVALALFVGFGVWGGIERQDLFLGTWHRHQRELSSILDCVPHCRPGTGLVLRSGNTAYYLATEADYLSNAWLRLLYDTPVRLVRLSPKRPDTCRSARSGLECTRETRFAPQPVHLDYASLIVLDYDEARGRYALLPSLTNDPLGAGGQGAERAYQPERLIEPRARTPWQRTLLLQ